MRSGCTKVLFKTRTARYNQGTAGTVLAVAVTRDDVKILWDFVLGYGLIVLGSWSILAMLTLYDRWMYGAELELRERPADDVTDLRPALRLQSRR